MNRDDELVEKKKHYDVEWLSDEKTDSLCKHVGKDEGKGRARERERKKL